MTKIQFSVLISIYHKEKPEYFREALDSVFAQTLQPTEIILIEDGALTPELYNVISEYSERYPIFNIIKNEINIGLGLSLAKGIDVSSNEYILRMDTDDVISIDRFEKQIHKLNEGYDVLSCWSQLYEHDIKNVIAVKKRPEHHDDIVKLAHKRSPLGHAACAFRRSAVLRAGNYQHNNLYEDYDLWVRMILSGAKLYNIQEVLYYVRTSRDLVARRGGWDYLKNEIRTFVRFRKLGFYNIKDVIGNSAIRICVRILPNSIRSSVMKLIWRTKS